MDCLFCTGTAPSHFSLYCPTKSLRKLPKYKLQKFTKMSRWKPCHFYNMVSHFWHRTTGNFVLEFIFLMFFVLWSLAQKESFLTIVPYHSICKMVIFFLLFKMVSFFNIESISTPFSHKTYLICVESDFLWFFIFEVQPQSRSLLTILPDKSLNKMAIFATFQNDGVAWDFEGVRTRKLGESGGIFWRHFPKDISINEEMQNTRSSYDTRNAF